MAKEDRKLDENQDAGAEAKDSRGVSKSILIYGAAIMLSFFASLIFLYFAMMRNQDVAVQESTTPEPTDVYQASALQDTTLQDTTTKDERFREIVVDSMPKDDLFSARDKIKILELENVQRQKEIDHLWTVLMAISAEQKKREEEEKRRAAADSVALATALALQETKINSVKKDTVKKAPPAITPKPKEAHVDSSQLLAQRAAAIGSSAKIYSSMKPAKAAVILQGFDPDIAAKILLRMRQRQSAKILEAMKPAQAAQVCQVMVLGSKKNKKKS